MDKYQVLRPLTPDEYNELKASIRQSGVIYTPILIDEHGDIIDGYHRQRIHEELAAEGLQVKVSRNVVGNLTDGRKLQIAFEVNAARRHLTAEQITEARTQVGRRRAAEQSLRQSPQMADNWHAKQVGVSDKTVRGIRENLESISEIPTCDTVTTSDGRKYPRQIERKPLMIPNADDKAIETVKNLTETAAPEFVNAAAEGKITLKDAAALASFVPKEEQAEAARRVEAGQAGNIMEGLEQAKEARRGKRPAENDYAETDEDREETLITNTHRAFYLICEKVHFLETDYSNIARCLLAAGNDRGELVEDLSECIERLQHIKAALTKSNSGFLKVVK